MTNTIGQFQRHLNEFTTANASTALTIDFQVNGNTQAVPLTAANCVLTFNSPRVHTKLILRFIQDGYGGRTITLPISVLGSVPTLNLSANSSTVYELYFNGTNYYFTSGQITLQSDTVTLSSGVSTVITANLVASSKILVTLKTPIGTSLTTGYAALASDRTTGQPGSFKITALISAGTINTADGSTLDWLVIG